MTYLQAHKSQNYRRNKSIIIFGLIVVLLFIGIKLIFPHFFPGLFTSLAKPFWRTEVAVQNGSMQSNAQLLNENADLQRQISALNVQNASVQAIEAENTELKALMGRASTTPYILAAVLKRPPVSAYDELVIDIGTDHALSTTSLVYASGNVLIGKVEDIMSDTSKVILFSSPGHAFTYLVYM